MTQSITESPDRKPTIRNWQTALTLLTALSAMGAVLLHLMGQLCHRQYLRYWSIDASLFPKPADWILINGYYGTIDRSTAAVISVLDNLHWLALAAVLTGLYLYFAALPITSNSGDLPKWLQRQTAKRKLLIQKLLQSALFFCAIPCALFLAIVILIVPAAFGETAGLTAAQKEAADFIKGCDAAKNGCIELQRDGKTLATGFIIDISTSHIAIYDIESQRSRVMPLDTLELVSKRNPASKSK